jgi:hypothetical protein
MPKVSSLPSKNDPLWISNNDHRNSQHIVIEQLKKQVAEKIKIYKPIFTEQMFSKCRQIQRADNSFSQKEAIKFCGYDSYVSSDRKKVLTPLFENKTNRFEIIEITVDESYIDQLLKHGVVIAISIIGSIARY